MSTPKVIAFYLPQYHPTPDNDKWWGKGFTEWTNVGKAKPLFPGHYQPKVPADLGYYDLRLPEVREAQAALAKVAGIYGFCYYHYWFGNGKEELELPFNEVLRLGKPDFPFMLCWANESWHKKFWNKDGKGSSREVLIEQTYPGDKDIIDHFYRLLPAFKDSRYIKIDGKPAFMIYRPMELPDSKHFIKLWNKLAKKENLEGIYFIAQHRTLDEKSTLESSLIPRYTSMGFNGVNIIRLDRSLQLRNVLSKFFNKAVRTVMRRPLIYSYKKAMKNFTNKLDEEELIFPTIISNWDHTPRSGKNGMVLLNSTPENFKTHVIEVFNHTKNKQNDIIFLKSWNEWGEGNYVEPDLKFGKGYLTAIREAIEEQTT